MIIDNDFEIAYLLVAFALLGAILVGAFVSAVHLDKWHPRLLGAPVGLLLGAARIEAVPLLTRAVVRFLRLEAPSQLKHPLNKRFPPKLANVIYSAYVVKMTQKRTAVPVTPQLHIPLLHSAGVETLVTY